MGRGVTPTCRRLLCRLSRLSVKVFGCVSYGMVTVLSISFVEKLFPLSNIGDFALLIFLNHS